MGRSRSRFLCGRLLRARFFCFLCLLFLETALGLFGIQSATFSFVASLPPLGLHLQALFLLGEVGSPSFHLFDLLSTLPLVGVQ